MHSITHACHVFGSGANTWRLHSQEEQHIECHPLVMQRDPVKMSIFLLVFLSSFGSLFTPAAQFSCTFDVLFHLYVKCAEKSDIRSSLGWFEFPVSHLRNKSYSDSIVVFKPFDVVSWKTSTLLDLFTSKPLFYLVLIKDMMCRGSFHYLYLIFVSNHGSGGSFLLRVST